MATMTHEDRHPEPAAGCEECREESLLGALFTLEIAYPAATFDRTRINEDHEVIEIVLGGTRRLTAIYSREHGVLAQSDRETRICRARARAERDAAAKESTFGPYDRRTTDANRVLDALTAWSLS